jgi:hypothetical protein
MYLHFKTRRKEFKTFNFKMNKMEWGKNTHKFVSKWEGVIQQAELSS